MVGETLPLEPAAWANCFTQADETAEAGEYGVRLACGVDVELTATVLVWLHRYRFPAAGATQIVVDFGHSLGSSVGGRIDGENDRTITGHGD